MEDRLVVAHGKQKPNVWRVGFPTQVNFTCAQLRALLISKNCAQFENSCVQFHWKPYVQCTLV